jgi:hypothetical protein
MQLMRRMYTVIERVAGGLLEVTVEWAVEGRRSGQLV